MLTINVEVPVSHKKDIFLPFIVVLKSADCKSLIGICMILAYVLSSHKSQSSELVHGHLGLYIWMCPQCLCLLNSYYPHFIYGIGLGIFGIILDAFCKVHHLLILVDLGYCVCTYLTILCLFNFTVGSCLLMFCHISSGMCAFLLKIMLMLGLCSKLGVSEVFLFDLGLGQSLMKCSSMQL